MSNAYSIDLRIKVLDYLKRYPDIKAASQLFNIGIATIYRWLRQKREQGHVRPKHRLFTFKRIDLQKLEEYLEAHPDQFLSEIATHFSVSISAIHYACKRCNITRKKKQRSTRSDVSKNDNNLRLS